MQLRRFIRAAIRGVGLAAWTAGCMAAWRVGATWVDDTSQRAWRWRCAWFCRWARGTLRLLAVRLEVVGKPPQPPFLLVCNHVGYLDVAVLASHADGAFVAKSEVARWPLLGRLCGWMGTLFVDRNRRRDLPAAIAAIERQLALGRGVVLFPEGTSTPGSSVLPFHPPLLAAAVRARLPVAWAALSYATPSGQRPAAQSVAWWGDASFVGHLARLLALPRIEARLRLGEEAATSGVDRKELAARLWTAVAAVATGTR